MEEYVATNGLLSRLSLRRKLIVIIMLVSSATIVLMGGIFVFYQIKAFRQRMISDLSVHAEMLADNCTAALSFNVSKDAEEVLDSLKAKAPIMMAVVYSGDGSIFAQYQRSGLSEEMFVPAPEPDSCRFVRNGLIIFRQVKLHDQAIGAVYLQSDLSEEYMFLQRIVLVLALTILLSLFVSYVLALGLQRTVSNPVFHLVEVANTVAQMRNYSVRAVKQSSDELGTLTEAFNDMLAQVQRRDVALRKSEEKFRSLVEASTDWIWEVDNQGAYIYASPKVRDLLGYEAEEIIGKTPFDLMPEDEQARVADLFSKIINKQKPIKALENINLHRDGREIVLETNGLPIFDDDGSFLGYRGIDRDITERKQAEKDKEQLFAELEVKNAELEQFAYTVSHDLKSPLITIKGFLGFVEKDICSGNKERVKADIERIYNAVDKMQQLLDDLLELSRIGRIINPPEEINVSELAHEGAEMVHSKINNSNIDIKISSDMPPVFGDRSRLLEVFQNLLDNAAKFLSDQPGPCIEVAVRNDGNEPVFYVRDNGPGIDPRYHEKIFGLFEQLNQKIGGTGIGLAIVKRIVEVHGGRIWVESEGLGKGATFCLTLPGDTGGVNNGES